jgi:hypothetical protein
LINTDIMQALDDLSQELTYEGRRLISDTMGYIEFLAEKEDRLEAVVANLNALADNPAEQSKTEILASFDPILGA